MYTIVTQCKQLTCNAGAAASSPCPPSPTSPSLSHHEPLKGEQNLTAGAALTFSPPIAPPPTFAALAPTIASPPSKISRHITLIYSSLCYSQVAGLPTQPSKCLLVLPPFSPAVTLSLSPRCPSATLTTRLFVSIKP